MPLFSTMGRLCGPLAAALVLVATSTQAATDDNQRFLQDMQDCREGRTAQSRPDCEREARNALADARAEARRGVRSPAVDPAAQAERRCAVFPQADDRLACQARLGADARLSGSVEGGGVLREVSTPVLVR